MKLRIDDLTAVIDGAEIVSDVDLEVEPGEVVGLVGPNGSGKSTLLRCAYRVLRPVAGVVRVGGDDVWALSARETAKRAGVVVQEPPPEFDLSVWEVVLLGRSPHKGLLDRDTDEDHRIVDDALARVGMDDFAERSFGSLSGGEKQRVLLARASPRAHASSSWTNPPTTSTSTSSSPSWSSSPTSGCPPSPPSTT